MTVAGLLNRPNRLLVGFLAPAGSSVGAGISVGADQPALGSQ
jgi:hypothetical protein